jgi:hypothetical protein
MGPIICFGLMIHQTQTFALQNIIMCMKYTECSERRLILCAGRFQECFIGTHCGIPPPLENEGHLFGNRPIQ